jgi:hypothetical protein
MSQYFTYNDLNGRLPVDALTSQPDCKTCAKSSCYNTYENVQGVSYSKKDYTASYNLKDNESTPSEGYACNVSMIGCVPASIQNSDPYNITVKTVSKCDPSNPLFFNNVLPVVNGLYDKNKKESHRYSSSRSYNNNSRTAADFEIPATDYTNYNLTSISKSSNSSDSSNSSVKGISNKKYSSNLSSKTSNEIKLSSPSVKLTSSSPVVKLTSSSPVVKLTSSSPVVKLTSSSPSVKLTSSSPSVKLTSSSPSVKLTSSSPSVKLFSSSPSVKLSSPDIKISNSDINAIIKNINNKKKAVNDNVFESFINQFF